MSAFNAPTYYFTGIEFNSSFFTSANVALTQTQASALYLLKRSPDTATSLETFSGGILTNTISPTTASTTMDIGSTSTGIINIGTLGGRSAIIHIGDGDNNIAGSAVHINNGLNTASNVQILNGTGSTGTITLGSSTSTTNATGTITLGSATKALTANVPLTINYLPTALTGTNMIGYSTTDAITFTSAFTSGSASNIFTSSISLPAGIWMITYSLRIESAVAMSGISYNSYGTDNVNGTSFPYGQIVTNPVNGTTIVGGTGTFIIKSGVGGITSYNVSVYIAFTGGSPSILRSGAFSSNVQRTRIA
jgi:hypothetical protein